MSTQGNGSNGNGHMSTHLSRLRAKAARRFFTSRLRREN